MLLEPQIPRCYKSAKRYVLLATSYWLTRMPCVVSHVLLCHRDRRMTRAGVALPPFLDSVELKGEGLLPAIRAMVMEECDLPHVLELGDTHWDRSLTLYTRAAVSL